MSNATPTPQQQIKSTLANAGIPYKSIDCYGSQIVVTVWSESAARKWESLIKRFATVRGVVKARDYNNVNKGTCLNPTTHTVYRVFGRI